jgi:hypothetical protein
MASAAVDPRQLALLLIGSRSLSNLTLLSRRQSTPHDLIPGSTVAVCFAPVYAVEIANEQRT